MQFIFSILLLFFLTTGIHAQNNYFKFSQLPDLPPNSSYSTQPGLAGPYTGIDDGVLIVAGGANNQLATPEDGQRIFDRNILFAPDYVINSGGIISVGLEYLGEGDVQEVNRRVAMIPERLTAIWEQSAAQKLPDSDVADNMAMALIGRG